MEEALRMALQAAEQAGASRVLAIRLCVGKWSCVVPEALRFAFEAVSPGTLAEGAVLEIETPDPALRCAHCGTEFAAKDIFAPCPHCAQTGGVPVRGRELYLVSVDVE